MTETQERMLREVLDQLMTSYRASARELSATLAYLFGELPMAPFFKDKELFETILYLRETIVDHELSDLQALVDYYEEKKKQMRKYLTTCSVAQDQVTPPGPVFGEELIHVHIAETMATQPVELDQLAWQICTNAGQLFEDLYCRVIQWFESAPLPAGGEKDVHSAVRRHVRGLVTPKGLISIQWQLVKTILPNSIKYYIAQFASHFNGEQIVIMQFDNRRINNMPIVPLLNDSWLARAYNGVLWRQLYGGHTPDYAEIMNVVKREEPIIDIHFKIQLTEWLVYSKLIVSHCSYEETSQCDPIRLDLSAAHLFQRTPVRVYGGSDRRYWIQQLFKTKLSLKKWVILKRLPGHFWLTSDNPGFMININELQDGFTQFVPRHSLLDIRSDSVLYYPLSKDYCLKLEPPVELREEDIENIPIDYIPPSEEELDFVNGVTVSTYKKVVISNQRKTWEQIQV